MGGSGGGVAKDAHILAENISIFIHCPHNLRNPGSATGFGVKIAIWTDISVIPVSETRAVAGGIR